MVRHFTAMFPAHSALPVVRPQPAMESQIRDPSGATMEFPPRAGLASEICLFVGKTVQGW